MNSHDPALRETEEISFKTFFVGYLALLFVMGGGALAMERTIGLAWFRGILLLGGALFLTAAGGRPRILYLVVRMAGWFRRIQSPRTMRVILVVLGTALVIGGIVSPDDAGPRVAP